MLGLSTNNNKTWKRHIVIGVANFGVVFGAQIIYKLIELLPLGRFPTPFEFYSATLISLGTTLGFFGINKLFEK